MAQSQEFYGQCRLCCCQYMGSADHMCGCHHARHDHVSLKRCIEDDCACDQFWTTPNVSECYNCGHLPKSHESDDCASIVPETLNTWSLAGHTQQQMHVMYQKKFNEDISLRTLQRMLHAYNIRQRDASVTNERILDAVRAENKFGVVGVRKMHMALRTKHRLAIPRDELQAVMRSASDVPIGKDPRLNKKLHQKPFMSKGPNWIWSLDGHEKIAQPFSLYIYAVVDTFSRKVLALNALPDKRMATVSNWLLHSMKSIKGRPHKLMIDKGSEWNAVKAHVDVIEMQSKFNQRVEAFWGQLVRYSDEQWFRDELRQLEADSLFVRKDEIDKWCVWRAYSSVLQTSLNAFRDTHNASRIRKQRGVEVPTGYPPNTMWAHPEIFETDLDRQTTAKEDQK